MERFDIVESWLDNVGTSHSNSIKTRQEYKLWFGEFCAFVQKTPEEIAKDYESSMLTERQLMRKYAQYISAFSASLHNRGFAPCSIGSGVGAVRSFFKYNDLALGYVSSVRMRVIYHNRDITHDEVKLILDSSRPRERAFFAVMAQSGLRPDTICNLRYKHIKEDLASHVIPCKIDVPEEIAKGKYHPYFTFIGEEAVHYLESYLYTRRNLTDEDFLFVKQGTNDRTDPKSISGLFGRTLQKLLISGKIQVEQKQKNKPRNIRLYNLRKWFRKHANQAGFEFVQFWMGHTVNAGQDEHYRPTDVEYHRKLYSEKAMPFLRLEKATPTETEKTIVELKKQLEERDKQIDAMKVTVDKIQPLVEFVNRFETPQKLKRILDEFFKDDNFRTFLEEPTLLDKDVAEMIDDTASKRGLTQKETLEQLMKEELEKIDEGEKRFKELAKRSGMPMTRKEYEKRKAEREKARARR